MHIKQNAKGINEKKIDCHHDSRFLKTNYLKTNLLKQIKKISFVKSLTSCLRVQSYELFSNPTSIYMKNRYRF